MRPRRNLRRLRTVAALLAVSALAAGCSSWRVEREADGWQLLRPRDAADGAADWTAWARALELAHGAVEERLGPFERDVRAYAWTAAEGTPIEARAEVGPDGALLAVPGMGPARVSAFHVRSAHEASGRSGAPARAAQIYLGTPEPAAAVHELVHVRLAELDSELPLWFEEGVAALYADGVAVGGAWSVDGFACWPWRELRDVQLSDDELARLLALRAQDDYDARDNRLVHFVGWAVVFDLHRRWPRDDWRAWLERFERAPDPVAAAREALARVLDPDGVRAWLGRLRADARATRIAAAVGTWKLASATVLDLLLDALDDERDPEVRATLALNALLTATETTPGWFRWQRLRDTALPALRHAALPDPAEQRALRAWAHSLGDQTSFPAVEDLEPFARLWRE